MQPRHFSLIENHVTGCDRQVSLSFQSHLWLFPGKKKQFLNVKPVHYQTKSYLAEYYFQIV